MIASLLDYSEVDFVSLMKSVGVGQEFASRRKQGVARVIHRSEKVNEWKWMGDSETKSICKKHPELLHSDSPRFLSE